MIRVRASQIPMQLLCAHFDSALGDRGRGEPVGLRVGNLVHEAVTGHAPGEPDRVMYDGITGTKRDVERAVDVMSRAVHQHMESAGIVPVSFEGRLAAEWDPDEEMSTEDCYDLEVLEVVGHYDMVVRQGERDILVDLKCGVREPVGAMTQLCIYAWLHYASLDSHPVDMPETLDCVQAWWVPRVKHPGEKPLNVQVQELNYRLAVEEGARALTQLCTHGRHFPHAPGSQCQICATEDCPVRPQWNDRAADELNSYIQTI